MKYRTIVADPPWPVTGLRLRPWVMGKGGRRARSSTVPYSFMSMADIEALPIPTLAEDDAHLYLWITARLNAQGEGVRLLAAWGFDWCGEIVWRKPNWGLGAFPRPQHEILIVARRGSLPFQRRDVGSVQDWKQDYTNNGGKRHSVKPDGALDLVESNSPGPYLELFARRQRLGWDSWGLECFNHIGLEYGNESATESMQRVRNGLPVDSGILHAKQDVPRGDNGEMPGLHTGVQPTLEGI